MTPFQGMKSFRPAPLLNFIVRRQGSRSAGRATPSMARDDLTDDAIEEGEPPFRPHFAPEPAPMWRSVLNGDSMGLFSPNIRIRTRIRIAASMPAVALYGLSFFLPTVNWEVKPFYGYEVFWDCFQAIFYQGLGFAWMWAPNPLFWFSAICLPKFPHWSLASSLLACYLSSEYLFIRPGGDIAVGATIWAWSMLLMALAAFGIVVSQWFVNPGSRNAEPNVPPDCGGIT
jgi:hypothetical protein